MMPVYYTVDNVVEEVTPNSDFTLDLVFSSGERRRYDCDKLWTHESFWQLQDPDYFATARVFCGAEINAELGMRNWVGAAGGEIVALTFVSAMT